MKQKKEINFWHCTQGPQPEPVKPSRFLPMEMTAEQAAEEWTEFFLRATDLETRTGDSREITAYRLRFERLQAAEISGGKAERVELPELYQPRPVPLAKVHSRRQEGRHHTDFAYARKEGAVA